MQSLAQLQRAWNTDVSGSTKPCANCFAPNAPCRCSRCKLVRYCNAACQTRYHPIHKLECIDESKHKSYWGMFDDKKKSAEEEEGADDRAVLLARRSSKRRRALQRAAARNAMERARRARGVEAKGGPAKGKGAEEREETCKICQCEFTVAGDGGKSTSLFSKLSSPNLTYLFHMTSQILTKEWHSHVLHLIICVMSVLGFG